MAETIRFRDLDSKELRRLQCRLVDILDELETFCKEQGLTYMLTNGTCLGAVRHKGFIPWDDDLDVALPREDYEKLTLLWNKCHPDGRYVLCRPDRDTLTGVHITQIKDASTTCVYGYSKKYPICQGVKIDIEPIDGAPNGKIACFIQSFYANLYGLFAAQRVPLHNQPMWKKVVARLVLPVFRHKKFCYKVFSHAEYKVKKYSIERCDKLKMHFGRVYNKNVLLPVSTMEFEGKIRPVPHQYDAYLRRVYGEYQLFPPIEDRYPQTEVLIYDLDKSYTEVG